MKLWRVAAAIPAFLCCILGQAQAQAPRPPIYYLSQLLDVGIVSPTNNQVLTYDSASSLWKNATSLAGVSTLAGNTIFVDPVNGNNGTGVRGNMDKPFLTFSGAAAVATAGDMIFLRPGTYTDNSLGFELPNDVSLVGSGRGVSILKSQLLGTSSPFHGVLAPGNNSLISDLSIVAVSPTGTGVEHVNAISRRTGATKSWTNVRVENCYLYGLADCVFAGGASLGDMTFINCTFDSANDIFMWQSASNAVLSNCELRHTTLAGNTGLGAYGIYDGGSGGTVKAYNCRYVLAGVSTTGWSTAAEAGSHVELYDYVIDYGGQTPAATAKDLQPDGANMLFASNVRKVNAGGAAITLGGPLNNLPPDWQQARTVANLPLSPITGQTTTVTDGAASLSAGSTVTGGGSTKYQVWWDGVTWKVVGGGVTPGGTPAPPTTSVQFNNAGVFGGDANFTFNNILGQATFGQYPIVNLNDSVTNAVSIALKLARNTTGTAAAGIGETIQWQIEDAGGGTSVVSGVEANALSDASSGAAVSYFDWGLVNGASGFLPGKMRLYGSGGLSVNNTTDPGAGIIAANTGYRVGTAASTSGKILKSNGSAFVASTETYAAPGTSGNVLTSDGTNWTSAAPAAGGGVTTFTSGNLSPLFTVTPSSPTSGAISQAFTLSTAAANTVFGNATGSTAAPSYGAVVTGQITNSAVTLAKIQTATANSKLLGSGAAGSGAAYSELTLGTNLSMSGTTLNASGGGTVPGGSTTQLQYNNAGAFGGISSATFDGTIPITLTLTPAANTFATGLFLTDTTASTSANQQYSPSVILRGQGWHTGGTAGNQTVDFRITNVPFQSTLATSEANLNFDLSLAGGAYVTQMTLATGNANAATPQIIMPTGSAGTPSYSFASDTSSGWYRAAASDIRLAISSSDQVQFLSGINATWMATRTLAFGNTIASPNAALALDSSFNGFNILTGSTAGNWGLLKVGTFDGSVSAVTNGLTIGHHKSGGTPAAGMGSAILFNVDSSTTADRNAAQIASAWSTATEASQTAYLDFLLVNNATALASKMRLFPSGGLSVNNTTDPGAGVISANSGYWVGTAASTSGKILKSDGTKFIASTETYAAPGASGNVMKSDGTNWTSGTVTAAPGGSDKQIQFNDAGSFNGNTNFTIDKTTNTMTAWGMKFVLGPVSSGGWIDMPTTGPSGVGSGGSGTNPWVAYASGTGNWFTETVAGDVAYRNASGNRLFMGISGAAGGYAAFCINQTSLEFGAQNALAFSSTNPTNGTIDTAIGRNAAGVVEINNGTLGTYRQLKLAGVTVAPTASQVGNVVSSQTVVTSTVDQTATAETAHMTYTVPANVCAAGTTFRMEAWGDMDNGTTAITFTPRLRWGGTGGVQLQAAPTVVSTTTALTNKTWNAEAFVTIRTTGATGTAVSQMAISNHTVSSAGAYGQDEANSGGTAVTIDTTASKDLVLSWSLSATTGTPHVRTYGGVIELVKQ